MIWMGNRIFIAVIPVFLLYVMMKSALIPLDLECEVVRYGVRGTVVDMNNDPVEGIWVDVQTIKGDVLGYGVTNQDGWFYTERVSSDACEKILIRVWGHGYKEQTLTFYPPNDGKSEELPYQLMIEIES